MGKAPDAFRTISEVATWLDTPAHVLRFWESKFPQIKPVKRAGGRRYYRPDDMVLLGGIKTLLHEEGMTIKGVQKVLRDHGVAHVASYSPMTDGEEDQLLDLTPDLPLLTPQVLPPELSHDPDDGASDAGPRSLAFVTGAADLPRAALTDMVQRLEAARDAMG